MNVKVFDFHCDTALSLLGRDGKGGVSLRKNTGHIDLERAKSLEGFAQCFACFTTPWERLPENVTVADVFESQLNTLMNQLEENKDLIQLAYAPEDILSNQEKGLMSAVLTIEGPAGFGFDPGMLDSLYQVGFRVSTLGWNEKNELTGSNVTGGGLTEKGREYVRRAQNLGITVDVSHISDEGFWDIMNITQKPIIATHSNSRKVFHHSRNLTDEMFRAICETGGVAGFNQYAAFVGDNADLDTACDHILHFLELDPDGRHIALGGDLDGCDKLPDGFDGVQSYPAFAQRLMERGVDAVTLERIFWENALEVLKSCSM